MSDDGWRKILRDTRKGVGISQTELAERLGLSPETIRSYETKGRHPSASVLEQLVAALKIPNAVANEMRASVGHPLRSTIFDGVHDAHRYYTRDELHAVVETIPWPEFVVDDAIEVVAANATVQALWQVDFSHERKTRSRAQMNLIAVASERQFGDRVQNWDECVGIMISMFKTIDPPYSLEEPTPYFQEVINEFIKGDPVFLSRLLKVWERTEPMEGKIRWTYPVVWADPDFGVLRFLATVSLANEEHATFFNDWHPVDAETWQRLEQLKARGVPAGQVKRPRKP